MPRKTPAIGHGLRRFTLGSGPLKRTSDRLQCLARILLGFVLLIAIAVALAVATATYVQRRSEATAQADARHRVSAELVENASSPRALSQDTAAVARATAVWTAPSGALRREVITVPVHAKAGASLPIWVDRNGTETSPPVDAGTVVAVTVGYALLTYLTISLVAVVAYLLFRRLLDRSRMRRWTTEWAAVEPVWTGKVP